MAGSGSPSMVCDHPSPQPSSLCTTKQLCGACGCQSTAMHHCQKGASVVIAPGYALSRTKSNISVSLCDEFFNRPKSVKTHVSRPATGKDTEQLIEDLQQQITQLVHLLEQESHKQMNIERKESIVEEMNERWSQREAELNKKHESDKIMELTLQENALKNKGNLENKIMEEQFQEQINSMHEKHKIEMEEAAGKYRAISGTLDELSKSKQKIQDLQEQLEKKTEELLQQTEHLNNVMGQLQSMEVKLTKFEGLHKTDIGNLQRKYLASIESLENQNIDLKQLFAIKAEELCLLRAKIEEHERKQQLKMKANLQVTSSPVPQTGGSKLQG
ncbi:flagellum-associated coiled-coil domain-containing protein 1-like isoform X3 [Narcine bancroftii]|uniref:flagellum-associated coiled-coil domain-containing protein 1-like isoform X3 n=1 Tax=Narcine bancroftii TaxID=1343680 RepID=UPI0038311E89